MIRTENLGKRYGTKVALAGLALRVEAGELFCFLGPNGAGKTTTVKILAGLLRPSQGRALIGGFDVEVRPVEAKAQLGYIPDQPFLYGRLTGRELMALVAGLYRLEAGWQARSEELLAEFELLEVADQLVEHFSHGMRQRLAFAATFLHRPRVVLVDEPWVGLDPRNVHRVKRFLRRQTAEGLAVLMSTHSLSIAEELADRVGILHQGRLQHLGTVAEIKALARSPGSLEEVFLELTRDDP